MNLISFFKENSIRLIYLGEHEFVNFSALTAATEGVPYLTGELDYIIHALDPKVDQLHNKVVELNNCFYMCEVFENPVQPYLQRNPNNPSEIAIPHQVISKQYFFILREI